MQEAPKAKIKIQHDGALTIAVGKSRKEMAWKNKELQWSELLERLAITNRTGETLAEYMKLAKSEQDQIKDVGGFVGGSLKGGRRKSDAVAWRQLLTLDADFVKGDLWAAIETLTDYSVAMYSTHKHRPSAPRLRFVIPLGRPVSPDEYQAISRRVAADLGIDFFDDTTYEPHRLMYWPSTSRDAEYLFKVQDGPWLDPDEVLGRYIDWRDASYWPESSRQQQERKKLADRQGDPLTKPGVVGAFCRTYTIQDAIGEFLSEVYTEAGDGRYTYVAGSTAGGLVLYDSGTFAFSHHGTDPAGGKLVNAFDLVRLHKFGELDENAAYGTPTHKRPSYSAMTEFALKDPEVRRTLGEERLAGALDDFAAEVSEGTEWLAKLELSKTGAVKATIDNVLIILEHDPNLAGRIAVNEFTHRTVLRDDLPWRKRDGAETWSDRDDAELRRYLEATYGISHVGKVTDAFTAAVNRHRFHPVREYLEGLTWDGTPRLDTLLIDYLGAEDTPYTRAVTRKMLTAAVARILRPGVKFDNVLVMVGPQGLGKSYILKRLGGSWASDSLSVMQGKEAYEQLQGAWLIELAEMTATKKAEVEAVKHFISKQEDAYRVAYGRQVSVFKRQCVFFGSSNNCEFLKDKTGNRRFWPVPVDGCGLKDIWRDLTDDEVAQVWAEAAEAWKAGEPLYLQKDLESTAIEMQEQHTEESPKTGMVLEYLDTLLPENWHELDLGARRQYIHGSDFGERPEGRVRRNRVCAIEIWAELFNGDPKNLGWQSANEINDILRGLKGWEPHRSSSGKLRFGGIYGLQKAYVRKGSFLPEV